MDDAATQWTDFEHAFVYFVNLFQKNLLYDEAVVKRYGRDFLSNLDATFKPVLENLTIPRALVERNPGVSPLAQQSLLNYFQSFDGDPEELIPFPPESEDAVKESYVHIVGRISEHLSGEHPALAWPRAILVVNWMRGYTLARIISENWRYWRERSGSKRKSLATVIRSTMQDIEEYARFKFVKYVSCYLDVLRHHFIASSKVDLIDRIPKLHIFLEFGASQQTQISLMDLGLSRLTAIALSEIIKDTELTRAECLEWIKARDVEAFNLSPIMLDEVKHLQKQLS